MGLTRITLDLRALLAQRLNSALEQGSVMSREDLRSYYTVGYLTREDYKDLSLLNSPEG